MPKQFDRSKTAFLTQTSQKDTVVSSVRAAEEINQLKQQAAAEISKVEEVKNVEQEEGGKQQEVNRPSYQEAQEEIYENFEQIQSNRQQNIVQVI